MIQTKPLTIEQEIEKLRTMYTQDIAQGTSNFLLLGQIGVGKTDLARTARKPVLIDSFDPGGTKALKDVILGGSIVADTRYEHEDSTHPTAYKDWEAEFDRRRKNGMFNHMGTYYLDGFTTWLDSLKNQIAKMKGRSEGMLQIQDWQIIGNVVRDMIKLCTALPCDFILSGHLFLIKEEVSGRMIARFNSIPSLQINVPLLFDEIYVLQVEEKSGGLERRILTAPTGKYEARTRIGSRKFDLYEKPDIKYLLKKAGLDHEDRKKEEQT